MDTIKIPYLIIACLAGESKGQNRVFSGKNLRGDGGGRGYGMEKAFLKYLQSILNLFIDFL